MSYPQRCFEVLRQHAIGAENAMDCHAVAKHLNANHRRVSSELVRLWKQAYGVTRIQKGRRVTAQGKVRKTYVYYLETAQDIEAVLRQKAAKPAAPQFDASALAGVW